MRIIGGEIVDQNYEYYKTGCSSIADNDLRLISVIRSNTKRSRSSV